jgi:hypothetical protein
MLRIALGFSKNMHKYMLILCIFIHFFRNIMHKVDAYFSTSVSETVKNESSDNPNPVTKIVKLFLSKCHNLLEVVSRESLITPCFDLKMRQNYLGFFLFIYILNAIH